MTFLLSSWRFLSLATPLLSECRRDALGQHCQAVWSLILYLLGDPWLPRNGEVAREACRWSVWINRGAVIKVHACVLWQSAPATMSPGELQCLQNYLPELPFAINVLSGIHGQDLPPWAICRSSIAKHGISLPQRVARCCADEDMRLRVAEQLEQGIRYCVLFSNPMTFELCHFSVSYSQPALDKAFMSLKLLHQVEKKEFKYYMHV